MELELEVDPDAGADIAGMRPLAALREGRPRTQTVKRVWYDNPAQTLLRQGIILAEQRGGWRLERLVPSADTWLPGQPSPIIEEASERTFLTATLPLSLAPVAAFEGRRTISVHRLVATPAASSPPASPSARPSDRNELHAIGSLATASPSRLPAAVLPRVSLTLERGVLRSVAAERPVARITLSGGDHAVHAAALMIAAAVPVSVPRASLAAQACALATGGSAAPRHLGAPVLPDALMAVPDALAHIIGHLADVILYYAPAAAPPPARAADHKAAGHHAPGPDGLGHANPQHTGGGSKAAAETAAAEALDTGRIEAVHQMRVAVRRARSALSIWRDALPDGTLDTVRDGLKELGARLGQTRDWDVFVSETAPMVTRSLPPDERLDRLLAAAGRRRRDVRKALADYLTSSAFRLLGIELAWFAAARVWHADSPASADDPSDAPRSAAGPTSDLPPRALSLDAPVQQPEAPRGGGPATPLIVRDFAPDVLRHRWKKLVAAGKRIEELDIPALHGVRLRAKRVRYAAEVFTIAHEGKAAHRFIRRLSLLQQRLGVLNDGAVAAQLLQQLGGPSGRHAYAVGLVVGFTAAHAAKIRPRIIRAFEKLRRQPIYWA